MPWRDMDFTALRAEARARAALAAAIAKETEETNALLAHAQLVTGPSVYCSPPTLGREDVVWDVSIMRGLDSAMPFEHLLELMAHV
jgi:hypothetical protein